MRHGRFGFVSGISVIALIAGSVAGASASASASASGPSGASGASSAHLTPTQQAQALVAQMTLAEKITEAHGVGSSAEPREVPGIPSLGIPALIITNGPAGVGPGNKPQTATALPAPIAVAATWDPSAAKEDGDVIGAEAADLGNNLVEGPDINIVRIPEAGRTFESYSEDPLLSGVIGASVTEGVQSTPGVIDEVKHLDAYNQETNRNTNLDDGIVSEQALEEIYLPAFRQVVTEAGPGAVMCSYATSDDVTSCQDAFLTNNLFQSWDFPGFVGSDFGAAHSTVPSAEAGLDLEMSSGVYYAAPLESDVEDGIIPVSALNAMLVRRFASMIRLGLISHPISPSANAATTISATTAQADAAVDESIAEQSMVLLENTDKELPLSASSLSGKSIALIGPYAGAAMTGGGGSSHVTAPSAETVSPEQGIENVAPGVNVTYNDGSDPTTAAAVAKSADLAIVMVGDTESEGVDEPSLNLDDVGEGDQNELVDDVAAANPNTIVVVKSGNPVLMPWLNQVKAVLEAWYPGEEDGNAVANVLFGNVDPSGHLPVTFPTSDAATPTSTAAQWPGVDGEVDYSEGIDVGYRGYEAEGITPMFPFGYGLSYTHFTYSDLKVTPRQVQNTVSNPGATSCDCDGQGTGLATVTARVTNTGTVAGADVAQLYVGDPASATAPGEQAAPPRQLEGFKKVELKPGQSATVRFTLDGLDLSYFNDAANGWVLPDGNFKVYVGDSSALANLPLQGSFTVTKSVGARYLLASPASSTCSLFSTSACSTPEAPGTTFTTTAQLVNDGDYPMSGVSYSLRAPKGWTVRQAGPAPGSLAPGQTASVSFRVTVPKSAPTSSTAGADQPSLTAEARSGQGLVEAAPFTVEVESRAVTGQVTPASVTIQPGSSSSVTLSLSNHLGQAITVNYSASTAANTISVTPASGSVTVSPSGASISFTVSAESSPADTPAGTYPIQVSLGTSNHPLGSATLQVTVPGSS